MSPSILKQSPAFFIFHDIYIFEEVRLVCLFVCFRMPLNLDVVGLDSGKPFWQEYYISDVFFSVHHIGAPDVHLSHYW